MTDSADTGRIPRLHLVTSAEVLRRGDFPGLAHILLAVGGARVALHLRGHGLSGRTMHDLAAPLAEQARDTGAQLWINDRIDVALACRASGVQLGRASIPVGRARGLIGDSMRIGASVHDVQEATAAVESGADCLFGGTLYETASHPGVEAQGIAFAGTLALLGRPVIGIGGITPGRVAAVRGAGAHGVAVIRGIWDAFDPAAALRSYLANLQR